MTEDELDLTDPQILRKKAEELVDKKKENANTSEVEVDCKKLIYELRVKQAELELQNDAFRLINEKAEVALKKYTLLFDHAAMGYFLLEPDCTINDLNFTAADILCERRFTLPGINFKLFVVRESMNVFNDFFEKCCSTHAKESCKIMLGYDENPLCMAYVEGIVAEGEQICLLSVVNLSVL